MNEISRCCRLLGVKSGISIEELRKAYRDMVQVWHPDRFSANERLKEKAQEQLKQINLAYEFLLANAFQDGVLVEPPDDGPPAEGSGESQNASDPGVGPEPPAASRKAGWLAVAVFAVITLAIVAAWFGYKKYPKPPQKPVASIDHGNPKNPPPGKPAPATMATNRPAIYVSQLGTDPPYSQDILGRMISIGTEQTSNGADGLTIVAPPKSWWVHILAEELVSPPFVMRATVKLTDINEVHLYYGIGQVIFNWVGNPSDLRE